MSKLLIFTSSYPYGSEETYLETELPFLAEKFEDIVILPITGSTPAVRKPPDGSRICEPLVKGGLVRFLLQSLFIPSVWSIFFDELSKKFGRLPYKFQSYSRMVIYSAVRHALETHPTVADAIRDHNSTVAYSYWGHLPALAIPKLSKAGVKCWVRYHRSDLYLYASSTQYFPFREEIVAASNSVFVSEHGRQYFRQTWGNSINKQFVVAVSRLGTAFHGLAPAKREEGSNNIVVVSCSFIRPVKRLSVIAQLLKELSSYRPLTWHHFGGGTDPELTMELGSVDETNMKVCMHGTVPHAEIMSFFKQNRVDLFVNLSASEGIPVSIMEAISFDIPVVATSVDGVREIVITGQSGLLVELGETEDPARLAVKIMRELHPEGVLACSTPHAFWAKHFDAQVNFPAFARMIRDSGSINSEHVSVAR